MAIVLTPNIFRPFDLTPNDLIYAGHLVGVLRIMMDDYQSVFFDGEEKLIFEQEY